MSSHHMASTLTPPVKTPPSGIDQTTIGRVVGFLDGVFVPTRTVGEPVPVRAVETVVVTVVRVVLPLGVAVWSVDVPRGVPEGLAVTVPVVDVPLVAVRGVVGVAVRM